MAAYIRVLMRFLLAGFLILALPAAALAQARGQVLTVGFNNHYRPDCWTPMLVQLTSQSSDSQVFQIQIVQEDLDQDRVTYAQTVTLSGNVDGRPATTENFWVYFKPTPVDGGLPDATDPGTTLNTLTRELKVFLCDKDGKQLSTLPMTATILNIDPSYSVGEPGRSRKLILFVSDGTDKPEISDYSTQKGVLQDVDAVEVTPRDLPTNVIGYEAVDDIVWMDADANFLISGTRTPSLEAISQWVHQGGDLVVCQPPEAFKVKPFAQMLPVTGSVNGEWTIPMVDRPDLDVLRTLAHPTSDQLKWPENVGTFKVALVSPVDGAKVDEWMSWGAKGSPTFTPWLARKSLGLGAVTWVAQDLGNAALTEKAKGGWRYVWDRVFDWNNPREVAEDYKPPEGGDDEWGGITQAVDLGAPLRSFDLTGTAAALLAIACFFFIVYWVVAGPGIYLALLMKKRTYLSWYFFGLSAVAATGLTALIVKAVLRGPPQLRHVSVVRYAAGEPDGTIDSRMSLYIKQDGIRTIALDNTAPREVSTITPFSLHPQYADTSESLAAYQEYQIPVRDGSESDAVAVSIPYRSTSKKLQTHWVGEIKNTIDNAESDPIKIDKDNKLIGTLVNHTGYDLWHVFLGFKQPRYTNVRVSSPDEQDAIIYVEKWGKDDSLKLDDLISKKNLMNLDKDSGPRPMGQNSVYGYMKGVTDTSESWSRFWRGKEDDVSTDLDYALPMLTFFDRLPPYALLPQTNATRRYEMFRREGRSLDLSAALSAGSLVIVARAGNKDSTEETPMPAPLTVSDSPVDGSGTTIYQAVLPIDRSAVYGEPSTQPTGNN